MPLRVERNADGWPLDRRGAAAGPDALPPRLARPGGPRRRSTCWTPTSPRTAPADRGITSQLYGGDHEMRIQQEMVLGIGGWRALAAVGLRPTVCHMNEGHAAFAVLERARDLLHETGSSFWRSARRTSAGNVFTTHTPVPAGHRLLPAGADAQRYFTHYVRRAQLDVAGLPRPGPRRTRATSSEPFTMARAGAAASSNSLQRRQQAARRRQRARCGTASGRRFPADEVPITARHQRHPRPHLALRRHAAHCSTATSAGAWMSSRTSARSGTASRQIPDEELWRAARAVPRAAGRLRPAARCATSSSQRGIAPDEVAARPRRSSTPRR